MMDDSDKAARELVQQAFYDMSDRDYDDLLEGLQAKIACTPQVVMLSDEALHLLLALARSEIEMRGGICSYTWHETAFEPSTRGGADPDECNHCERPRSEHELRPVCPGRKG